MPDIHKGEHLKLWTPATYRIEVEGRLNESRSDRLGGMNIITTRRREDQSTVTTLTGRVRDQAELAGVLNSLYELHLPILSVENLSENNGEAGHDPDNSSQSRREEEDRTE
jgi:hypothetical protein